MAPSSVMTALVLPNSIISPSDISRILHELETFDDALNQATMRPAAVRVETPQAGALLSALAETNKYDLAHSRDREQLKALTEDLLASAPLLHISFAADPSRSFMEKIVTWLRSNIHPLVLVRVGLQPNIAAGCIIRTPNKLFDCSMRRHFAAQQPELIRKLKEPSSE